jgi:hypothetical protein
LYSDICFNMSMNSWGISGGAFFVNEAMLANADCSASRSIRSAAIGQNVTLRTATAVLNSHWSLPVSFDRKWPIVHAKALMR